MSSGKILDASRYAFSAGLLGTDVWLKSELFLQIVSSRGPDRSDVGRRLSIFYFEAITSSSRLVKPTKAFKHGFASRGREDDYPLL